VIDEIPDRLREALFLDQPHAGAVIDTHYKITEINKRWVDLFGWSYSEMEEMTLLDLAEMQRDKRQIDTKVILMIDAYVAYDRIEFVARTKLGDLRKVLIRLIAIPDQARGGKMDYALVWADDLGGYEEIEDETGRLRRLWPYIVPTTALLWFANFPELAKIILSAIPGLSE